MSYKSRRNSSEVIHFVINHRVLRTRKLIYKMARKSRSNKRQKKKGANRVDHLAKIKQELATLIDQTREEKKTTNTKVEPLDISSTRTPLSTQYASVFARFQTEQNGLSSSTETPQEPISQVVKNVSDDEDVTNAQDAKPLSKRKLRLISKPSLSKLKSLVVYPQVIQWYDCDAKDPELLAKIKSHKNVVPVPNHWQLKREYLSGRSVMAKRPFELPDIIRQTNIEEMRNTLPNAPETEESSLKDVSRARVQPKLGSLDIDFKKLHDAFFKLGARWKPDLMLSYGDLFYENRNLDEESRWRKMEIEMRPGRISDKLRNALGLPEGKLPPWCAKIKELGLPPAYPNYKIAGLNWDITNLKGNIYGSIGSINPGKKKNELFGRMVGFEEVDEEEYDAIDIVQNVENSQASRETETKESLGANQHSPPRKADQKVTENVVVTTTETKHQPDNIRNRDDGPQQLYTVLTEKERTDGVGLTGNGVIYDIPNSKRKLVDDDTSNPKKNRHLGSQPSENKLNDEETIGNFKF